jgi:putative ATPase
MTFSSSEPGLFSSTEKHHPLAYLLAPKTLDDYVGQEHLVSPGKPIRNMIENDALISMIFWGPPGCGKTSLSRLLSSLCSADYFSLNAVTAKIADLKEVIIKAISAQHMGRKSILFLDEIHRFNKAQQDALLPDVESGLITLIGATTENPFFSVIPGLVSRCHIFQLHPHSPTTLSNLASRAFKHVSKTIDDDALKHLVNFAEGDARKLLNTIELISASSKDSHITSETLDTMPSLKGRSMNADDHYDMTSALIKSMRGSDPDAAVYWLARLLHQGEDPEFIARRLIIFASEDIGNADPQALVLASALIQAVKVIGMPEIRINLSHVTTYLASAPKSNAAYKAIGLAQDAIRAGTLFPVPEYLKDASYKGAKQLGHGKGYLYPHNYPDAVVKQTYMPEKLTLYTPKNSGYEAKIKQRLDENQSKRNSMP